MYRHLPPSLPKSACFRHYTVTPTPLQLTSHSTQHEEVGKNAGSCLVAAKSSRFSKKQNTKHNKIESTLPKPGLRTNQTHAVQAAPAHPTVPPKGTGAGSEAGSHQLRRKPAVPSRGASGMPSWKCSFWPEPASRAALSHRPGHLLPTRCLTGEVAEVRPLSCLTASSAHRGLHCQLLGHAHLSSKHTHN